MDEKSPLESRKMVSEGDTENTEEVFTKEDRGSERSSQWEIKGNEQDISEEQQAKMIQRTKQYWQKTKEGQKGRDGV